MNIGIIGHAAEKFTKKTESAARQCIQRILSGRLGTAPVVISGRSPMGGVDIWAEEEAAAMAIPTLPFPPAVNRWDGGFKERNLQIANASDEVHVIVVKEYPLGYAGRRFDRCYHCHASDHVKSGACWTAHRAMAMGKPATWHRITATTVEELTP